MSKIPEIREVISSMSLKITQKGVKVLEKLRKLKKTQHVVAYCFRFFNHLKTKDRKSSLKGQISQRGLKTASHVSIRLIQTNTVSAELSAISRNENVSSKSFFFQVKDLSKSGYCPIWRKHSERKYT